MIRQFIAHSLRVRSPYLKQAIRKTEYVKLSVVNNLIKGTAPLDSGLRREEQDLHRKVIRRLRLCKHKIESVQMILTCRIASLSADVAK